MQLFRMCRDAADTKLNTRASCLPSWSSKGFSNLFLQPLPLANLKGLGHLFMVTARSLVTANHQRRCGIYSSPATRRPLLQQR